MQPPQEERFTTIVFAPGVRPAAVVNALIEHDARLVWADPQMAVVVVAVGKTAKLRFYSHGALLVSGSGAPGGCFNWSRV